MAKIIVFHTGNCAEVKDGELIKGKAEELGIPFGCKQGLCGTCRSEIIEGMENLNEKNNREIDMGLENNERLICQCTIKKGVVKIKSLLL